MKNANKNEIRWRKLDNTAKIFPIISTKNFSNVFRISVVLKEEVIPEILQNALEDTLPDFKSFQVKLKRGFFWYYFETNTKTPKIEEEKTYPCKYIDRSKTNGFLFQVSYYKKRINLEVFHSLADGNGALHFLKALTYRYLSLLEQGENAIKNAEYTDICYAANTEDSYIRNYKKDSSAKHSMKRAYQLKGPKLPLIAVGAIHGHINLEQFLTLCRAKHVTISEYLTALLIWCIYKENLNEYPSKQPIKIYIPVNLRKYFDSTTTTNFFSYITVDSNFSKQTFNAFDDLLYFVKDQFDVKLTKEHLTEKISSNVSAERNIFVRLIPLFIKKFGVKIGYLEAGKHHTSTLSNLGKITVLPEFKEYIDYFSFLIAPSRTEKIKCSVCSYENDLVFSFASILEEPYIEREFFRHLVRAGVEVKIESNGVYHENM